MSVENVRNKETETPFEGDRRYMSEIKKDHLLDSRELGK